MNLFPGLVGVVHSKEDAEIFPLLPGHYETYDLQPSGKVIFKERVRFHDVGQAPVYKTMIGSYGEWIPAKSPHSFECTHCLLRVIGGQGYLGSVMVMSLVPEWQEVLVRNLL